MAVRQERAITRRRDYSRAFKLLFVLAAFYLLVAGGVFFHWKKAFGEKQVLNVLEIAPTRQQAVLGYYIGFDSEVERGITEDQLNAFVQKENQWDPVYGQAPWQNENYKVFFYNQTGSGSATPFQNSIQPYSVVIENGRRVVVNNELFKLLMLKVGSYDFSKSPYDNYIANQGALAEFDSKYQIKLQLREPAELTMEDIEKADYIHFDSGINNGDIENFNLIYAAIMGTENWNSGFKEYSQQSCDITFEQAVRIYEKTVSESPISISIPGEKISSKASNPHFNIYKLQMMLNFFDDPCKFKDLFGETTEDGGKKNLYIDMDDGTLFNNGKKMSSWQVENFQNDTISEGHIHTYSDHCDEDGDYIPAVHNNAESKLHDNILIYDVRDSSSNGFFSKGLRPFDKIEIILKDHMGSSEVPDNPEDASVHILEIEPCNSFKFKTQEGRERLAAYIYGSKNKDQEKNLDITFVTPDTLNGMTDDLAADYDLIYIGENVNLFGEQMQYRNEQNSPYNHMGDMVRTDTLINGLRTEDYTTREAFKSLLGPNDIVNLSGALSSSKDPLWNENLKEKWASGSGTTYFLKNMTLLPELHAAGNPDTSAGEARFSGNDLTDSMKDQLEEFIKKDMPIIVSGKVYDISVKVKADIDNKGSKPQSPQFDANIYQVLAENMEDSDDRQIFREPEEAEEISDLELPDGRPEVKILFDGNETILPVEGKTDEDDESLIDLKHTDKLSFSYDADESAAVTLIIDRNGDGLFTEANSKVNS